MPGTLIAYFSPKPEPYLKGNVFTDVKLVHSYLEVKNWIGIL